jgi:hypothetical protein
MSAPTPTIITGTSGVASVSINSLLYDCVMGSWRGSATKQYFPQTTFCSSGWRDEQSGLKACDIVASGYLSHGNAISDPLASFGAPNGVACIFQADTGSTISGTFHIESDFGIVAAANSEFGVRARSKGAVSSTWNITT